MLNVSATQELDKQIEELISFSEQNKAEFIKKTGNFN